jgi:hypothetical protein
LFAGEQIHPYAEPTKAKLGSTSELLRLLFCASCSVRVQCLRAALSPPPLPAEFTIDAADREHLREREAIPREWGCWGGSFERDRLWTEGLPVSERVELLEGTFAERLGVRIDAWRVSIEHRSTERMGRFTYRDRRVAEMLSDPEPLSVRRAGQNYSPSAVAVVRVAGTTRKSVGTPPRTGSPTRRRGDGRGRCDG